ncbi:hypothetical protein EHQ52_17940 [Leptospira koniambonensis]|uniref:Uncharacterized protein n=1 Tax=Leptospira koniambonensis TaxID=2484950 RepID=A0A4R9J3U5_9LEPT|nr:hypothetical protein [Leptospira koniambonensis]TGL28162.1 hypothetical protein EHQ52_17940 [Leptospira koniambonensis]
MKRASILFPILLIFLQVQCGTYLLFDSYEKQVKSDETDLSPLLTLLGSNDLPPLNVEPISWMSFPSEPVIFTAGTSGSYSVSGTLPYGPGCNVVNISFLGSKEGVNITVSDGSSSFWDRIDMDDCFPNYSDSFNISGSTPGKARVVYRVMNNVYDVWFPGIKPGQIIGVINVTVSTTQTVTVTAD